MEQQTINELSLFDMDNEKVYRRRKHHRICRPRSENVKAFRSFLIAYKLDMEKGRKIVVKKLQNQFHVGHFPKNLIPVKELRRRSLEEIDDAFTKVCYKEIQKYNLNRDSSTKHEVSRQQIQTHLEVSRESAVELINSAISCLQDLRTRLNDIFNS